MTRRRNNLNSIAALAAACLLVLQSVLGAVAMGGEPVQRDIFGNVICTDGFMRQSPANGHDGGHLPECCVLGCSGQFVADVPATAEGIAAPFFEIAAVVSVSGSPVLVRSQRTPANPRAPPEAV